MRRQLLEGSVFDRPPMIGAGVVDEHVDAA